MSVSAVDQLHDIRERLVAVCDEIDNGNLEQARTLAFGLLEDLDEAVKAEGLQE